MQTRTSVRRRSYVACGAALSVSCRPGSGSGSAKGSGSGSAAWPLHCAVDSACWHLPEATNTHGRCLISPVSMSATVRNVLSQASRRWSYVWQLASQGARDVRSAASTLSRMTSAPARPHGAWQHGVGLQCGRGAHSMAWTPSWPQISPTKPSACEAGNEGHGGEGGVRAALPSSTKPRPFDGDEDAARSSLSSTTSCRRCSSQRQLPAA